MGTPLNLIGAKFGMLVVVGEAEPLLPGNRTRWICDCECGGRVVARSDHLRSGDTSSCGCLRLAQGRRNLGHRCEHGMSSHPAYRAWTRMRNRCRNPQDPVYRYYGGRGISVCEAWDQAFEVFWADMGPTWAPGLSLDRIDNSGNYEPGNCRWATAVTQSRNRRNVKLSMEAAEEIRRLFAADEPLPRIARQFRVSRSLVRQVVLGLTWRP